MTSSAAVITEKRAGVGCLTLDKPKTLNALDLEMFEAISAFLDDCASDDSIRKILIQGTGDRAFCSGGDVRKVATENVAYGKRFFGLEYGTDLKIHLYPKPVIALGHGITMGGGLGLLAGARVRLLAEDSVVAMPEVSIGFFTDVGASWFLNRMPGRLGTFLGMTGARLTAWEAVELGLADQVVKRADYPTVVARILAESGGSGAAFEEFSVPPPAPARWKGFQGWIDQVCGLSDPKAAYHALLAGPARPEGGGVGGEWIQAALGGLKAGAPSSALLIHRELTAARGRSIEECFARELELAFERMVHPDFREGVRAQLIDKDRKPRWTPTPVGS